jgi:hypothetical protein
MDTGVAPTALPVMSVIQQLLAPLGIASGTNAATGDSDSSILFTLGVPSIELRQDATRYFDYHHTANDTFDKIDPRQLDQNVAAFATAAYVAASVKQDFGPPPAPDSAAAAQPLQPEPAAQPKADKPPEAKAEPPGKTTKESDQGAAGGHPPG